MLLAIDTATDWASIALYDEEEECVLHEETWWARRQHTTSLMPRIDAAFHSLSLMPSTLSGVVVAIGPGSYTGLRVGLSLAKGLSLALDIPLVGIPTLDVVAYPHRERNEYVCAIIQAGRTRVCWAVYPPGHSTIPMNGYHLTEVEKVVNAVGTLGRSTFVCGEVTPAIRRSFETALGVQVKVGTPADGLRRAAYLAELGLHALDEGRSDDPATLSPIYLRHPEPPIPSASTP